MAKTTKVVKVKGFVYHEETEHPYLPGQKQLFQRIARRGDEITLEDLRPYDRERAETHDVFFTDEEAARFRSTGDFAQAVSGPATTTSTQSGEEIILDENSSVEDLAAWIAEDRPTIDEVLELADSPEMAQKLLEAETRASDGDPRKGVVEGLTKVIGQA